MSDSLSQPERLASVLRSTQLAGDMPGMLGHLVGAELAATRALWIGQQLAVLGHGPYAEALTAQGVPVINGQRDVMIKKGFAAIGAKFKLGK